jgi:hypothetical protein
VTTCPNCGFENRATDRFCAQCGRPLAETQATSTPQPASEPNPSRGEQPNFMPPPVQPGFQGGTTTTTTPIPAARVEKTDFDFGQPRREPDLEDASDPEWRMSSLGPPPERKRRRWLWILLILLGICILACIALFIWLGFTDSGRDFIENIEATATAQAG